MLTLIISAMLIAIFLQFSRMSDNAEMQQLNSLQKTLQARINDTSEAALSSIDAVVSAPGVAEAFAERDRDRLQALTLPVFKALKQKHNIQQFQFHTPPATSFLRLHKLEKHGDDLSSFRHTVVGTNNFQRERYGLEEGVAGIGLRGVIPVYYDRAHIGSAEVGLSFGQDFFDSFTERYSSPAALYVVDSNARSGYSTFASTIPEKSATINNERFQLALSKRQFSYTDVTINNKPYTSLIAPIEDFSGKPLVVAEILIDRTEFVAIYNSTLIRILLIGVFFILLGLILSWILSQSITKPIEHLTKSAEEVSRGNFETKILGTERKDEIGSLARAVSRMSESIKLAIERLS